MNNKILYALLAVLFVINILEFLIIDFYDIHISVTGQAVAKVSEQFLLKEVDDCPNKIGGNPDSLLRIKYFYDDDCPYCRQEGPILERLVNEKGNLFYIEWYNLDKCKKESIEESVYKIPFFTFVVDGKKIHSGGGFVKEQDMEKFICDVSKGC